MGEGFAVILAVVRRDTLQFTLHADTGLGETAFNVGDGFFEKVDAIPEQNICVLVQYVTPTWLLYLQMQKVKL